MKHQRGAAKKAKVVEKAEPITFEDTLDEALALEDKGDRYQSGDKARRFYLRASDYYQKAHNLKPDDADVLYNHARLLLLLAEFTDPEPEQDEKQQFLEKAVNNFKRARTLVGEIEGVDAGFNLAQALRSLAEVLTEERNVPKAVECLKEAHEILVAIFDVQQREWEAGQRVTRRKDDLVDALAEMEIADKCSQSDCGHAHHHQHEEATSPSTEEEEAVQLESTTPAALIDTLTTDAQILNSLSSEVLEPESTTLFELATDKLFKAHSLHSSHPTSTPDAGVEIQLRWAELLSCRGDTMVELHRKLEHHFYDEAVKKLDSIIESHPNHVEALCDRGDVLCSWADAIRTLHPSSVLLSVAGAGASSSSSSSSSSAPSESDDLLTRARTLYANALASYTSAYAIAPTSQLCTKLGDTNLVRITLYPTTSSSVPVLASNAEKYYRHSVQLLQKEKDKEGLATLLWKLSKALSWRAEVDECKKVLGAWKKLGGFALTNYDEDVDIDFHDSVAGQAWHTELIQ
ncbi:hypothetical protein HDU85_001717 [Gaertneriomyces sp. JEL0708]|nr:hypothetical protein HDU85_001717 [Gaertneriomyces sp. JEL0708]